ncbi:MAG: septum site-determining protein MinC [Rhodospirillales bacterium]|nr:septum site-determining protein MinC [Rhodospirillales bacterium]
MTSAIKAHSSIDPSPPPFQIRGGAYTLLVLRLNDPKDPTLFQRLADKIAQAPNFFRHAPVVIDLQALAAAPAFNMAELGRRLRQHQLVPIGVQNGTDEQNRAAVNAGWSLFPEGRQARLNDAAPSTIEVSDAAPTTGAPPLAHRQSPIQTAGERLTSVPSTGDADAAAGSPARVVTQPVRSGRQVYAHRGDLVVLASTSAGAELLADGHIHVYGALRGRALAGVSGDTGARIFCRSLEAELVSIAGYWRVREDIPEALIGKSVQIALEGDRITIEPLT